jgi:lysophospholipase L1-like esterase
VDPRDSRYLFIGDSVTDCQRLADSDGLGTGYVRVLRDALEERGLGVEVVNRGISGNRVKDLRARWSDDCIDLEPELVSVLIGINDTWRRYDSDDPTTTEAFEADYRHILERTTVELDDPQLVLVEPFLLPARAEQDDWFEDLEPKIAVVRTLADDFGAILVTAQEGLTVLAGEEGPAALAADGVHPTPRGHQALAGLWLDTVLGEN